VVNLAVSTKFKLVMFGNNQGSMILRGGLPMDHQVVLLSGGIESTALLYRTVAQAHSHETISAITFDCQSKNAREELSCASWHCQALSIKHTVIDIASTYATLEVPLLNGGPRIPTNIQAADDSEDNYVPFRNGIFIAIATAIAHQFKQATILIGSKGGNTGGFPDSNLRFLDSMQQAILAGSIRPIRIAAPLIHFSKFDTVRECIRFNVPLHRTWSCYESGPRPCTRCSACLERHAAFSALAMTDPVASLQHQNRGLA